jgi:putative ABC transport system permease protein
VPPIAAVREGATLPESRYARFRLPASILLTALGFGGLLWGLFAPNLGTAGILFFMLGGALLVFFGIALLSVRLVTPLAGALGWPATKIGGTAGVLARENSQRNPQRTASTASALMIGLALVTLVTMLAAGIISSFKGSVNEIWKNADYAITAQNNFSPIPVAAAEAVAKTPGVEAVGNVRAGEALAFGKRINATAVNPAASQMFNLDWQQGSGAILSNLGEDGAFVDKGYAKSHHLELGSPVPMTFADGSRELFNVKGIFAPPTGGSPFGPVTISAASFDRHVDAPQNLYSFVLMKGGQTPANAAALDRTLKAFPNAKAATRQKFIDNQISGLSSVLNILYVLLALSVVVSLFGIVNTLVLTVFERTREIGMLRAIGMTRRQVRRMIRHESVITALIGAAIGIALGIVLAALLIARVDFIVLSVPVGQLIIFGIAAIFVGILAAIFPARRAARLNVLEALQYE